MKHFSIIFLSFLIFLSFQSINLKAEEGMFLPAQIPYDSINENYRADLTPEKIQKYMKGVMKVYMGGSYGSGSFITPKGLILTNWHVAYDCIQTLREMGTIRGEPDGFAMDSFYAETREEELHCPNYESHITLKIEDITDQLTEEIPANASEAERSQLLTQKITSTVESCNEENTPAVCEVKHLPNVDRYLLQVQNRYKDVRLVYIPSSDMGAFGGDAFNFQYPRYAADFAFLRAYAPNNGSPSNAYDESHIPLNTSDVFLVPKLDGVSENDFVMILGYPGGSDRVLDGHSLKYRFEHLNPLIYDYFRILSVTADQVIAELEADESQDAQSQLEGLRSYRASVTNGMQAYQAMIEGAAARDLVQNYVNRDERLATALAGNETLNEQYGDTLPTLVQFYQNHVDHVIAPQYFYLRAVRTNAILSSALQLIKYVRLAALPEGERPTAEAMQALRAQFMATRTVSNMDRKFMGNYFNFLLTTPGDKYPAIRNIMGLLIGTIAGQNVEPDEMGHAIVNELLRTSPLFQSEESRSDLLTKSESHLIDQGDTWVLLGITITGQLEAMQNHMAAYQGIFPRPPKRVNYIRALQATNLGGDIGYYDANRTLRLTYGKVSSYQWGERRINFASTFSNLMNAYLNGERALSLLRPEECFFAGRCAEQFGDTQVNFAATLDVTGGNSGSAVINQEGKVVGALFDGNWESVVNDFDYRESGPERSVSVSLGFGVKYAEWDIQRHDKTANVVEEIRRAAGD